jgi:glycosyltransferase involved in cell wall biosynthesis
MHLIVLESELTSRRGGQELNLFEVCRGLADRGYRISLLYLKPGDLLEPYRKFCDRVIQVSSYGFDRRRIGDTLRFIPSMAQVWQIPVEPDSVIFVNDYHFSLFGYALSYLRNLPYLCYLQIPPCDFNRQRRLGLSRVNRFIAVSQQTKQDWVNYGYAADAIDVVYNGTDIEKFQPAAESVRRQMRQDWGVPEEAPLISYVGRIDSMKGLETLIQATAHLTQQGANPYLLLAGKPVVHYSFVTRRESEEEGMKYQRSLEQMAAALGVGDRVQFLGHLPNPVALYQASDVSVLPSVWQEPFGRSIIESLACGTPVVGSRIGGIPEVLTGEFVNHLFQPEDAQDLAQHLAQVMHWRQQDPGLGDRAQQHVWQHFTYDRMVNGIDQVLQSVPLAWRGAA